MFKSEKFTFFVFEVFITLSFHHNNKQYCSGTTVPFLKKLDYKMHPTKKTGHSDQPFI